MLSHAKKFIDPMKFTFRNAVAATVEILSIQMQYGGHWPFEVELDFIKDDPEKKALVLCYLHKTSNAQNLATYRNKLVINDSDKKIQNTM